MPNQQVRKIQALIEQYEKADKNLSEANVEAGYIAQLFKILGWETDRPTVWNHQAFIRGAGYADVALQINNRPVAFLEAKRFGKVQQPTEATLLEGEQPLVLSSEEREARGIDRTPEEKQAMRYARAHGIRWAILTNFERLILFDADEERIVLAFDSPQEYVERFDELKHLAPADTPEDFDGRLAWYKSLRAKPDVDAGFYEFLTNWRIRLAQAIYDHNAGPDSPLRSEAGEIDLDLLRQAVQRTLDRLIIIRYADDVGFLEQHDLLENRLSVFLKTRKYAAEYEFQHNLISLYRGFYRNHDTTIFGPNHICEQVNIPNAALVDLVRDVSGISFRKFTSDILGNTYESYLGQRLILDAGQVRAETDRDIRKGEGIYYTPRYIVEYIVDHTLGRWLYGTVNGKPDGAPLDDVPAKTVRDLDDLRLVDPAMGSGSFLIYAFDVLADFYERENRRIDQANAETWERWGKQSLENGLFGKENEMPELESPVPDYIARILQNHLYGVDLDPEAVEIAGVNLIMRAFDRLKAKRRDGKLPLILRQNLKIGNSLISGVTDPEQLEPFHDERLRLIALREELRGLTDDAEREAKLAAIEAVVGPVNQTLNAKLERYFGDHVAQKHPFNWQVEFPEVFDPDDSPAEQGFTLLVGNPPYVRIQKLDDEDKVVFSDVYTSAYMNYDLYVLFVERSVDLLRRGGDFGFILPNKFFQLRYGAKLRQQLVEDELLSAVVDFGDNQIFPGPTTYTCLLFLSPNGHPTFRYFEIPSAGGHPADVSELLTQTDNPDWEWKARFNIDRFSEKPWVFAAGIQADVLRKSEENSLPLGDLSEHIIVGIQTSADAVYILENRGRTPSGLVRAYSRHTEQEYELEPALLKPLISGEHVSRYGRLSTNEWLLYPYDLEEASADLIPASDMSAKYPRVWAYLKETEAVLRGRENGKMDHDRWYAFGRSQNIDKQENTKLVVPRLVERLGVTYDPAGRFYLDNVDVNGVILKDDHDPHYVLAVLNSSLIAHIFSQGSVPFRGNWLSANRQFIEPLPIRMIDPSDPDEVAQHDALITLAQRMLDLNAVRDEVAGAFQTELRGHERRAMDLEAFLRIHEQQISRTALIDANDEGLVSSIEANTAGTAVVLRGEIDEVWHDVLRLDVPNAGLRSFVLLALRQFLYENRRKRVWSRGKVAGGVLEALEVPALDTQSGDANLKRIAGVIAGVRQRLPDGLPAHDLDPLDLTAIEQTLAETDAEIDQRVYDLYGLTDEERRAVAESLA